jgi:Transposase
VVDHFHLVRGANAALDSVRRERQREAGRRRPKGARLAGRSSWRQDLYRAGHRPLKARDRVTERERRRLCQRFEREPLLAEARGLKEAFRSIYRAQDRNEAERRLDGFPAAVDRAQIPSLDAFANGVRLWREEPLAYLDQPTTNGHAEGVNNKIKATKRRAHGPPTLDGLRQRVLPACARTGPRRADPAQSARTQFSTGRKGQGSTVLTGRAGGVRRHVIGVCVNAGTGDIQLRTVGPQFVEDQHYQPRSWSSSEAIDSPGIG